MSDLKACPFCGGDTLEHEGDDKIVSIRCAECEATGPNQYDSRLNWNTRADGWQPIDTAPELEDVLVYMNGRSRVAYFGDGSVKHPREWISEETRFPMFSKPTHWRHLPAAPQ